jgi:hypothetical protein
MRHTNSSGDRFDMLKNVAICACVILEFCSAYSHISRFSFDVRSLRFCAFSFGMLVMKKDLRTVLVKRIFAGKFLFVTIAATNNYS